MADESMMHHAHLDHAVRNRGAVIVSSHGRSKRRCHELHAAQHKASMSGTTRTGEGSREVKKTRKDKDKGRRIKKGEGAGNRRWRRRLAEETRATRPEQARTGPVDRTRQDVRTRYAQSAQHRSQKRFSRLPNTT
jgi:hypothetical protein